VKQNPYTLPFVNCKHRSRIRVVDVFPSELELFAHSTSDPNWATQSRKQSSTERWEWGFVLLVEDADIPRNTVSEKLRVVVNNAAAQHLLNMDALE
jgi:protection-of-telomeres protein 1